MGRSGLHQKRSIVDEKYPTVGMGDRRKLVGCLEEKEELPSSSTYMKNNEADKAISLINFTNDT